MHTSRQYDGALEVLGETFADANASDTKARAPLIVKIGGGTAEDVRASIAENLEPLGVQAIAIGQLSPVDGLENDLVAGGAALSHLRDLKEDGLVGRFVLEIFPWTSAAPLKAIRSGHLDGLIDGVITYYNPLQRFASNERWAELVERNVSIISMRDRGGCARSHPA